MKAQNIFIKTEEKLIAQGFDIERKDFERPWGGFLVIDENQAGAFVKEYFPDFLESDLIENRKVSPKILLVAPHKRLSWQYHHRRSEVWRVIEGSVGVVKSKTDEEGDTEILDKGRSVVIKIGERHRLVGLHEWGIIAEIWQHTDSTLPSDENDIVRLQDDFGRKDG